MNISIGRIVHVVKDGVASAGIVLAVYGDNNITVRVMPENEEPYNTRVEQKNEDDVQSTYWIWPPRV